MDIHTFAQPHLYMISAINIKARIVKLKYDYRLQVLCIGPERIAISSY